MLKKEEIGKDIFTIGGYFPSGGETYTTNELLFKLENDLGLDKKEANILIGKCVEQGFITECGNGVYTR